MLLSSIVLAVAASPAGRRPWAAAPVAARPAVLGELQGAEQHTADRHELHGKGTSGSDTYTSMGGGYCDPEARMGADGRTDPVDWGRIPNLLTVGSDAECQTACSSLATCNYA